MADRIEQLRALLEQEPNDPFCLYGLGMEYARLGQHESAIAWFDLAINANPDDAYAYYHKAKSQQLKGNREGAQQTLQTGLERAESVGDQKAMSEIESLLDDIS